MVAATRIITKEDVVNCAIKKKRRGRPTVLEMEDFRASLMRGESFRQAVNAKYSIIGAALVSLQIGDDDFKRMFDDGRGGFYYQGALEQIGRLSRDDTFNEDDLSDFIGIALDEIRSGVKSKVLETTLRKTRLKIRDMRKNFTSN